MDCAHCFRKTYVGTAIRPLPRSIASCHLNLVEGSSCCWILHHLQNEVDSIVILLAAHFAARHRSGDRPVLQMNLGIIDAYEISAQVHQDCVGTTGRWKLNLRNSRTNCGSQLDLNARA